MTDKNTPNNNGREIRPSPTISYGFSDNLSNLIKRWEYCAEDKIEIVRVWKMMIAYYLEDNRIAVCWKAKWPITNNVLVTKTLWSELIENYYRAILASILTQEQLYITEGSMTFIWNNPDKEISILFDLPPYKTILD